MYLGAEEVRKLTGDDNFIIYFLCFVTSLSLSEGCFILLLFIIIYFLNNNQKKFCLLRKFIIYFAIITHTENITQ